MFWLAAEPVPYYSCCFLFWPASQSASLLIFCQAFYLCITKHHLNLLSILLFFIFFFAFSVCAAALERAADAIRKFAICMPSCRRFHTNRPGKWEMGNGAGKWG